jgi:hypothetical protein
MLAATAAFFFACSDDSSSDNGAGAKDGKVTVETSGTIKVDSKNKTVIMAVPNTEEVCVNEDAGIYKWENVDFGTDSTYSKYLFVGDTLVMLDCEEIDEEGEPRYCDDYGQMLVGGNKSNLNGTWKAVPCMYDVEDSVSSCFKPCSEVKGGKLTDEEMDEAFTVRRSLKDDEDMATAMATPPQIDDNLLDRMTCLTPEELTRKGFDEGVVTISGTSVSSKVTYYYEVDDDFDDDFDDYMNSRFMSRLYSNLADGYFDLPGFGNLDEEDSSGVEEYEKDAGINVLKQTKNSVSFKFKDQTFSVSVKEFRSFEEGRSVSFTIGYNKISCDYQEEEGEVTKNTCNAQYGEFFDKGTRRDANDNEITIAYEYEKSNEKTFSKCIESIEDSVYALTSDKSNSDDDGDCGRIIQEYYVCSASGSINSNCDYMAYQECIAAATDDDTDVIASPDWELYKKATSSSELAKKKFLKVSRKFARKMKKFAE